MAGRDGAVEKNWGRGRGTSLFLDLLSLPKLCSVDCITEAKPEDHEVNIPEN